MTMQEALDLASRGGAWVRPTTWRGACTAIARVQDNGGVMAWSIVPRCGTPGVILPEPEAIRGAWEPVTLEEMMREVRGAHE